MQSDNVIWHRATVTRKRRAQQNQHRSVVLWFTGLSGSGKSTLAHALEEQLYRRGGRTFVLDGDNVRHGLCGDLGFSDTDRVENIRRVGELSKLFLEAGVIVLTAFISPFRSDRRIVRKLLGENNFIEVYCHCSLDTCEERDVKGLYKLARAGEIKHFTGISSPYEEPTQPELVVKTDQLSIADSVQQVMTYLEAQGLFPEAQNNIENTQEIA
ncbi:adenylyl-sulfate kinase [Candidatus Venteria ishoeyi]|uniref:Adenylyl-sulfate kinase n=1 Tax=Candidatus Venteria ishoeyi TaxID=1899563 RepID=A0A1H6FEW2_9GAMM|nr:adenylyl-sulfate kinase [Candidatus Venteria ishoeyi]MDM8546405.1 adenylyl-sulfate kinase [Candidatus Venteria ishoeyi]SEH07544.1 putative adenylyl-sulfate kinase [Candidatus Venteria ishoeyi]